MRLLLLVVLSGVAACGDSTGQFVEQERVAAQPTAASSPESWPAISDEEVREGCLSFTEAVANEHSNEVYDPQTGVLQVWVGPKRILLSSAVEECRENAIAMQRLKFANAEEATTQKGVRHVLYTHCGVVSTTVEGVLWLADPRLSDGGNPPPGWDENETPGVFRQTDGERAVFVADSGVEATFTKAKQGARDEVNCD